MSCDIGFLAFDICVVAVVMANKTCFFKNTQQQKMLRDQHGQ